MQRLFEVMITIKDNDRYFQSSDKDVWDNVHNIGTHYIVTERTLLK